MRIVPTTNPVAIRQESTTIALNGTEPKCTAVPSPLPCALVFNEGVYQYVNQEDSSDTDLVQGGLIDLGSEYAFSIREFRASVSAGNITLSVESRDGAPAYSITFSSGSGVYKNFYPTIAVLPSQVVKITTANAGTVPAPIWCDLYVVKATPL